MTIIASDEFTGANGTLLSTYSPNWERHPASAAGVNAQISNNGVRVSESAGGAYYRWADTPPSADQSASSAVIRRSGDSGSSGVFIRMHPTSLTCYFFQHDENNGWRLFRVVGGTFTQLGSSYAQTLTLNQPYIAKLEAIGNQIKAYVDGVERFSFTDTAIPENGDFGINVYANGGGIGDVYNHHLDSFVGEDLAAAGGSSGSASGAVAACSLSAPSGTASSSATAGTITSAPFKNNAGTVMAALTVRWAAAIRLSDFAQVKVWSNPVTNGSGQLVLSDAAVVAGTDYALATSSADGASVGIRKYTAA